MPLTAKRPSSRPHGLTLIEGLIALALIAVLLSILLPALSTARQNSHREQCADNQRMIGEAWQAYLADHDKEFPYVPSQPAWYYGGMRFSTFERVAYPDYDRPLTTYLNLHKTRNWDELCVCCPADRGITGPTAATGTGDRSAFESYGTSYRANAPLLDARLTGLTSEPRGMRRSEITTAPARLVLSGDPVWYEVAESTGRDADWHGVPNAGNLLFLDGHVRFAVIKPKAITGPVVFDPIMSTRGGAVPPASASHTPTIEDSSDAIIRLPAAPATSPQ